MVKFGLLLAMTVAIMPEAMAQTALTSNSTSTSSSGASASSGSEVGASSSRSGGGSAEITINDPVAAADPNGIGSAADPASNNVNYSGTTTDNSNVHYSGSETIHNVPDQATLIETPTAPCMVPVGGTISIAGFGGAAQGAYTSQECETLERIRMTWNMNQEDVADQMMCQFIDYRNARAMLGKPCPTENTDPGPKLAAASYNNASSKTAVIVTQEVKQTQPPPVSDSTSSLEKFCNSLSPENPNDQPYIDTECAH